MAWFGLARRAPAEPSPAPPGLQTEGERPRMHPLHIALQDGFRDQHVVIRADGRVVYDRRDVTTDLRISHADEVEVTLDRPQVRIEVTVRPPALSAGRDHDATAFPYLAVSVAGGEIVFRPSGEAFRYL